MPRRRSKIEQNLQAMFQEIPPEMRVRYARLDQLCRNIRENYGKLSATSQIFVKQMQDRLDGLLQGYLRLLHAEHQHLEYLRNTNPETIKREIDQLVARAQFRAGRRCRRSTASASRS